MVKIRSVEELQEAFDNETTWRKKEIHHLGDLINSGGEDIAYTAKRASIVMLYANWEGWIKNISQYYIQYVKSKKLSYSELSDAFLANALRVEINAIGDSNKSHVHQEIVKIIRCDFNKRSNLHEDYVDTQSNLSIEVFKNILNLIGISPDSYISSGMKIDESLLAVRNKIAHGERYDVPDGEFEELKDSIISLLEKFKNDVINHAYEEKYKFTQSS